MKTEDEKTLKDAGWKIYSKEGDKKFWESPHDRKVYSTSHALIAQAVAEDKEREEEHVQAILGNDPGFKDLDRYTNWEVDIDELWPPPKKAKVKKKQKKASKKSKAKNISELGF